MCCHTLPQCAVASRRVGCAQSLFEVSPSSGAHQSNLLAPPSLALREPTSGEEYSASHLEPASRLRLHEAKCCRTAHTKRLIGMRKKERERNGTMSVAAVSYRDAQIGFLGACGKMECRVATPIMAVNVNDGLIDNGLGGCHISFRDGLMKWQCLFQILDDRSEHHQTQERNKPTKRERERHRQYSTQSLLHVGTCEAVPWLGRRWEPIAREPCDVRLHIDSALRRSTPKPEQYESCRSCNLGLCAQSPTTKQQTTNTTQLFESSVISERERERELYQKEIE